MWFRVPPSAFRVPRNRASRQNGQLRLISSRKFLTHFAGPSDLGAPGVLGDDGDVGDVSVADVGIRLVSKLFRD